MKHKLCFTRFYAQHPYVVKRSQLQGRQPAHQLFACLASLGRLLRGTYGKFYLWHGPWARLELTY